MLVSDYSDFNLNYIYIYFLLHVYILVILQIFYCLQNIHKVHVFSNLRPCWEYQLLAKLFNFILLIYQYNQHIILLNSTITIHISTTSYNCSLSSQHLSLKFILILPHPSFQGALLLCHPSCHRHTLLYFDVQKSKHFFILRIWIQN